MDKKNIVMLVSAGTDFVILFGTSMTAAMTAKGDAMLPSWPVIVLCTMGGIVAFARTVQQNIKKELDDTTTTTTTTSSVVKENVPSATTQNTDK